MRICPIRAPCMPRSTSTLDEKIGEVVDTIDNLGIRDNTPDHFPEAITAIPKRNALLSAGGSNGPFRGHKFTLWEGGIRVPCIMSWPGKLPQNEVRDEAAMSIDILPLIAHYCEADLPDRKT